MFLALVASSTPRAGFETAHLFFALNVYEMFNQLKLLPVQMQKQRITPMLHSQSSSPWAD